MAVYATFNVHGNKIINLKMYYLRKHYLNAKIQLTDAFNMQFT